jgi:hypothetical protein
MHNMAQDCGTIRAAGTTMRDGSRSEKRRLTFRDMAHYGGGPAGHEAQPTT